MIVLIDLLFSVFMNDAIPWHSVLPTIEWKYNQGFSLFPDIDKKV